MFQWPRCKEKMAIETSFSSESVLRGKLVEVIKISMKEHIIFNLPENNEDMTENNSESSDGEEEVQQTISHIGAKFSLTRLSAQPQISQNQFKLVNPTGDCSSYKVCPCGVLERL